MNNISRPPLSENLRIHCISVRLNNSELNQLDHEHKSHAKCEWLRMCFIKHQPDAVSEVNRVEWTMFGELNQSLNEIMNHLNAKQSCDPLTKTELFAVKPQISELRSRFLTSGLWSIPSHEGHAEDQISLQEYFWNEKKYGRLK